MKLFTCPGCSNACELNIPTPKLPFDLPAIPSLPTIPELPELPKLPKIPTPAELLEMAKAFAIEFAGTIPMPSLDSGWKENNNYSLNALIQIEKLMPEDAKGERKTYLVYKVIVAGISGATKPVFCYMKDKLVEINLEVKDNTVVWKFVKENKGVPGSCPNSKGSTKD